MQVDVLGRRASLVVVTITRRLDAASSQNPGEDERRVASVVA